MDKKTLLLGISGGIATYKTCELARRLMKQGYRIFVVMTTNASQFVTPLTFRTLTDNPVFLDTFSENMGPVMPHISLSRECSLMAIVPATANIIGKIAHGIGDDLLSTLCLSFPGRIIIAPAMNSSMYENPVFQNNLALLRKYPEKYMIIDAVKGELACGEEGMGRLADIDTIVSIIKNESK